MLLSILMSKNIISDEIYSKIHSKQVDIERNSLLLDHILKGSQQALDMFIDVLKDQNQCHVANFFRIPGENIKFYSKN